MTVAELITFAKTLRPGTAFSEATFLQWVNELEAEIQTEVFLFDMSSVTLHETTAEELLADAAHTKLYWLYLAAMIDLAMGELRRYQDDVEVFRGFMSDYKIWYADNYDPANGRADTVGYYITAYSLAVKHGYEGSEADWVAYISANAEASQAAQAAAENAQGLAEAAKAGAEGSAAAALVSKTAAETAQAGAQTAQSGAENAKTASETAQAGAQTAQGKAEDAQALAETAREGSEDAAGAALLHKNSAETAREGAEAAQAGAEGSAAGALISKTAAETAQAGAQTAKTGADNAKTAAETARDEAQTAQAAAKAAQGQAEAGAVAALQSAAEALASAQAAANSANASAGSAKAAETAKNAAVAAKGAAETAKTAAEAAKGLAETARAAAETAKTGAVNAKDAAVLAKTAAQNAQSLAETAAAAAQGAKTAAEAAKTAAETAQTGAETARAGAEAAQTGAEGFSEESEAWACGTIGGVAVAPAHPAYHNNAKWYKEQAAEIVGGDYPTKSEAQGYATTAKAEAISAAAADATAKANTAKSEAINTAAADATVKADAAEAGANTYTNEQIAAIPTPDVSGQIAAHNTSAGAHENLTPVFTDAASRANISSGETLKVMLGKIKKFFSDLKTVAFTGAYADLSGKPALGTLAAKSTVAKADLEAAVQTSLGKADTAVQAEADPTVPAWAKAASKPGYTYAEISGKPTSFPPSEHRQGWDTIDGKPTSFAPSAHKASHAVGGADVITPSDIGAAKAYYHTGTLTIAGWAGTTAPFTQTFAVPGMTANDVPAFRFIGGMDDAARPLIVAAWGLIVTADVPFPQSVAGGIKCWCKEKPTVNVPVYAQGVR